MFADSITRLVLIVAIAVWIACRDTTPGAHDYQDEFGDEEIDVND